MPLSKITDVYLMPDQGAGETNIGFISTGDLKLSFTETYNDVTLAIDTHETDPNAHGGFYIKKTGDTGVLQFTMYSQPVLPMDVATRSFVETYVFNAGATGPDEASAIIASQMFS